MKTIDLKEMTQKKRFDFAVAKTNHYARMFLMDIIDDYRYSEDEDKKSFIQWMNITINMAKMRGYNFIGKYGILLMD